MMKVIHYHGTPITPRAELLKLGGHNFCVSFYEPRDVEVAHQIGQSVMLDNGAFSFWKKGGEPEWERYYEWVEPWLKYHTTWAVIPDVIDGTQLENNRLIDAWPFPGKGAPVWHLHEDLARLRWLVDTHERVCFGSSAQYAVVGSYQWHRRVTKAFNAIGNVAWVHMLRGMQMSGFHYPFSSVDSTDVARNFKTGNRDIVKMARRWDSLQCPAHWDNHAEQRKLL